MTDNARHLDHARELLRAHPVFDGHNDLPWAMRRAIGPGGNVDDYDLTTRTAGHTDLHGFARAASARSSGASTCRS